MAITDIGTNYNYLNAKRSFRQWVAGTTAVCLLTLTGIGLYNLGMKALDYSKFNKQVTQIETKNQIQDNTLNNYFQLLNSNQKQIQGLEKLLHNNSVNFETKLSLLETKYGKLDNKLEKGLQTLQTIDTNKIKDLTLAMNSLKQYTTDEIKQLNNYCDMLNIGTHTYRIDIANAQGNIKQLDGQNELVLFKSTDKNGGGIYLNGRYIMSGIDYVNWASRQIIEKKTKIGPYQQVISLINNILNTEEIFTGNTQINFMKSIKQVYSQN